MEGNLISWWAGELVWRYLWSSCHRVDEAGRAPPLSKCVQAISWWRHQPLVMKRLLLSRALRMSYTRSWAVCCLAEDRQQHSHISIRPPYIATDEFYADVHIPFNHKAFFSFLVKIWLIAMGTPKQQSFALPGSRLEMPFVRKRPSFSSLSLHWTVQFLPLPCAAVSEWPNLNLIGADRDWSETKSPERFALSAWRSRWLFCLLGWQLGTLRANMVQQAFTLSPEKLSDPDRRTSASCPDLWSAIWERI